MTHKFGDDTKVIINIKDGDLGISNKWIKVIDIRELINLGFFLGQYARKDKDMFGRACPDIYHFVSHFAFDGKELHIRQYPPPVKECVEVNQNYLKLTHYMIIESTE
jgi:hypothetical protein